VPAEEIIVQAERIVRIGLTVLFTYTIALWVAATWWTYQDIRSRSQDRLLQFTATLFVVILNFPGLLVYLLLRPHQTLEELYYQSLEEDALLRSLEEGARCPSCQEPLEPDFLFCPACQARLRQRCERCERPVLLRWRLCPYCGASLANPAAPAPPARQLVKP
jgi:hypothetical protein